MEKVLPSPTNPPRLVTDFSGNFLTQEQNQELEKKLVAYDDSSSNQIAIVIVDDLGGYSIDEYAVALGRKWGVGGQKQFSNGIVILVNTGEKGGQRGVFLAVGYGLEGAVTDLVAEQIVQSDLLPNFRAGNNYRAFDNATDDIMAAAAGRYKAPEGYHKGSGRGGGSLMGLVIAFIVLLVIIKLISRGGGGGGGYVSRRGYRGGPIIFPGGWSSGSGGGGWSGGGGGGFGGFGGGSFGGGGAGGSW
ncbi:hypothetical protein GCM10027051_08780 [Niabella terrae]